MLRRNTKEVFDEITTSEDDSKVDMLLNKTTGQVYYKEQARVQTALKYDEGKPKFSTVPKGALLETAKVFTYGANKYGKHNYSGKMVGSRYIDAAQRHILAYEMGEDIDESGHPHLAHAIASLMMALDGILIGQVDDDRNPMYLKNK